jgi:hypothetical protein
VIESLDSRETVVFCVGQRSSSFLDLQRTRGQTKELPQVDKALPAKVNSSIKGVEEAHGAIETDCASSPRKFNIMLIQAGVEDAHSTVE